MASSLKPPLPWEILVQTLATASVIFRHAVLESSFISALSSLQTSVGLATLSPCLHLWPRYEHDLTYNSAGLWASCFCTSGPHYPASFPGLTAQEQNGTIPITPDGVARKKPHRWAEKMRQKIDAECW